MRFEARVSGFSRRVLWRGVDGVVVMDMVNLTSGSLITDH
jgi:hypothetical protein